MKAIELNGGAGGGQMLRSALSLAMITGQPFRMINIRGQRRKPGLMRQHLTCVKAACEISGGTADGAEIGSTELVFRGAQVRGGSYEFAIGTAGSTSLLLQTLLPALWLADEPSTLRLEGGTHNPLAPPFDFVERAFLPRLAQMGARVKLTLETAGFAPVGGGVLRCEVEPCAGFEALDLTDRGDVTSKSIRVLVRDLPLKIPGRILDAALKYFPCDDAQVMSLGEGPGRGVVCLVEAGFADAHEVCASFGEHGTSSEKVGKRAARMMNDFIGTGAAVGRHLADQLLLPMALAGGGRFTTMAPGTHVSSNIEVIERFLDVKFSVEEQEGGRWEISVSS